MESPVEHLESEIYSPGFQNLLSVPEAVLNPQELTVEVYGMGWSFSGFKAAGEDLQTIHNEDRETLSWAGVSYRDLAGALRKRMWPASDSEHPVTVEEKWVVRCTEIYSKFGQECPAGCSKVSLRGGKATHRDFEITSVETGRSIQVSELLPHLIEEHEFFEGRGTKYRLYPLEAVSVLGLSGARAKEEIDQRIYEALLDDLNSSPYNAARTHAAETLSWFAERPDIVEKLSAIVADLFDKQRYHLVKELFPLIQKINNSDLNTLLLSFIANIPMNDPQAARLFQILERFRREVVGPDTNHPIINDMYRPDFVKYMSFYNPRHVEECETFVEKNKITADTVQHNITELIQLYYELLPYGYRTKDLDELLSRFPELKMAADEIIHKAPPRLLDQIERRIGWKFKRLGFDPAYSTNLNPDKISEYKWSKEEVEVRIRFYTHASNIAAFMLDARRLKHYQTMIAALTVYEKEASSRLGLTH